MAPGTFDDRTHEQLAAMLANGAPAKVSSHAQLLQDASRLIAEISVHVRAAVDKADWSGESATAYRAWAKHFAQEGGQLSTYANTVGGALQRAGQALTDAQAAMPRPAADASLKGEQNAPIGDDPATMREKTRQEAIRTLERLDSYYSVTTTTLRTAEEPNFRPPEPPGMRQPVIEFSSTGSGPVDRPYAPPSPPGGPAPDPRGARENSAADAVRTSLDSVAAPAPVEARSQPTPAASTPSQGTSSGLPPGPNASVPPLGPTTRPGTAFPPGPARGPGTAQGHAAPRTPTPGQPFPGSTGGLGTGGNAGASTPGRAATPAPHPGIHGGRMRPAEPPTSTARGTVIGGPAGPIGSTGRPGTAAPAAGPGVPSQQQVPARRLATEPGGTAPLRRPAGAGSGAAAPRNGVIGGASAPAGSAPTTRGEQRKNPRSNRPPGLASDRFELSEEQLKKIVPPVIG